MDGYITDQNKLLPNWVQTEAFILMSVKSIEKESLIRIFNLVLSEFDIYNNGALTLPFCACNYHSVHSIETVKIQSVSQRAVVE